MEEKSEAQVLVRMTVAQAQAVDAALDLYTRVCIGQLEEIANLVRDATIPLRGENGTPRVAAKVDVIEDVDAMMRSVKAALGYERSGSNGIGHRHVHVTGHRAYEVHKALAKALAVHRNPNPDMRGVHYDGLLVRYTQDPAPTAEVVAA